MNNMEKLIVVLTSPADEIETAFYDLLMALVLDNATGVVLDRLGSIVGQDRNGQLDDVYRRYIRARIATNNSQGDPESLLTIARLIVNDPTARLQKLRQAIATVVLRVLNVATEATTAEALATMVQQGAVDGVRVIVESSSSPAGTTFKWDTPGRGWDSAPWMTAREST